MVLRVVLTAAASVLLAAGAMNSYALGGPSGPNVKFDVQGTLGEVVNNPYDIAPLTSVIRN